MGKARTTVLGYRYYPMVHRQSFCIPYLLMNLRTLICRKYETCILKLAWISLASGQPFLPTLQNILTVKDHIP